MVLVLSLPSRALTAVLIGMATIAIAYIVSPPGHGGVDTEPPTPGA